MQSCNGCCDDDNNDNGKNDEEDGNDTISNQALRSPNHKRGAAPCNPNSGVCPDVGKKKKQLF